MKMLNLIKNSLILWVWQHTPNCTEMSRLASKALDEPLPLGTWLKMRLHFLICVWCHRYFKQLEYLHHAGSCLNQRAENLPDRRLPAEARERIIRRLKIAGVQKL